MPGECHARPGRPPGRRGWREDRVPPATPHPAGREQAPCPRLARAYAVPHSTAPGTAGKLRPGERRGLVPGSRGRQNPEWGGGVRLSRPAPTPPIGFPLTIRAPEILRHLCPPLWGLFLWASPLGHRRARAHPYKHADFTGGEQGVGSEDESTRGGDGERKRSRSILSPSNMPGGPEHGRGER